MYNGWEAGDTNVTYTEELNGKKNGKPLNKKTYGLFKTTRGSRQTCSHQPDSEHADSQASTHTQALYPNHTQDLIIRNLQSLSLK
jgi:hypothetical protein